MIGCKKKIHGEMKAFLPHLQGSSWLCFAICIAVLILTNSKHCEYMNTLSTFIYDAFTGVILLDFVYSVSLILASDLHNCLWR